jgi:D-alanyl-D-alanine carboxypeptidase
LNDIATQPLIQTRDLRNMCGIVASALPDRSGVGNLRTGQPPQPVQTFRVASQTKAFVATIVLQLVADGRVGLDAPVSRYLPRLLPDGDQVTVRQLLNHTSGLYDPQVEVYQTLQDIYDLRFEHWTPRQVMALANDNGLLFPPGTAWSYSNTNYVVAGLLIERVTGTSIARQLERRLIRPLALRHTWFPTSTAALPPPRLHGYLPLDDQPPLADADITRFNPSFFWASGALVSNVDDLDRFYDALFDGRLPPKRLLAEMLTPVDTGAPGTGYGLGLEIYSLPCGATMVGHTGALPGYNSGSFRLLGDDKDARVVANLHPAPDALYLALSAVLFEIFCGMAPAEASAAARANPGTAGVIRFR